VDLFFFIALPSQGLARLIAFVRAFEALLRSFLKGFAGLREKSTLSGCFLVVHSQKQIQQIANSIARFGFTNPVPIGDDDEILGGAKLSSENGG
jgi:hypothetical protein